MSTQQIQQQATRQKLIRAVGTIGFFTMLSRISGFARDIVIARIFGASMGADAFFVALKLPNFLRRLFSEGAFNSAFVPVFSTYRLNHDHEELQRMAQAVFTILATVLVGVVVIAELFMPAIVYLVAPGFAAHEAKYQLTVMLTHVTFPYILFISLVGMAGGILNSYRRFAVPAATSIILNLCLILGALAIAPWLQYPAMGLAIGVLLGGIVQLAVQWPALARIGITLRWRWEPHHPAIGSILRLMGPSILGVSVAQVNLLVDLFIASWLPEGSISYLYYADRLVEFPLGLIGVAMGTAILPSLSEKAHLGDVDGVRHELDFALRLMIVVNMPAMVGLILLREPLITLLFGGGAFDTTTTGMTARALIAFSVGLLAFSAIKIVAPAFYAFKDTRAPVRAAIVAMGCNILFSLILILPLSHAGLALATSLAAFVNLALLLHYLRKKIGYQMSRAVWYTVARTMLACAVMGGFLLAWNHWLWQPGMGTLHQLAVLVPELLLAVGVFIGTGWLVRLGEIRELFQLVRPSARAAGQKTGSPDPL